MSGAEKILRDLETLTRTIDLDSASMARLAMSPDVRISIRHHIARCLRSLRELEIVIEGRVPAEDDDGPDFPI